MTERNSPPVKGDDEADSQSVETGKLRTGGRLRERGLARLARAKTSLQTRRPTSRVVDTGFLLAERNRALPAPVLVGSLATRLVIFVIPFFVLMVFAVGLYADLTATSATEAARRAGMAGIFAHAAEDSTDVSEGWRAAALLATGFAVLWAAATLARLVRRIFALVWEVPLSRLGRPWALPIVVIGIALMSLALSGIGLESQEWAFALVAGAALIEFVIVGLIWLTVTRFLPHDPAAKEWWHFLPGAVLFAVGFVAMKIAVIVYLAPRSELLTARYGSVATAIVLLTWAYLIGFIVVTSADLNAAMFRSLTRQKTSPQPK